MNPTLPTGRCVHGLNPKACLPCFNNTPAPPKRDAQPRDKPLPYNEVVAAVRAKAVMPASPNRPAQPQAVPLRQRSPAPGTALDSAPAQARDPERPVTRGRMPQPVLHRGPNGPMVPAGAQQRTVEPFDYAQQQGRYRKIDGFNEPEGGVWEPTPRESLIDRLSRHPSPGFVKPT